MARSFFYNFTFLFLSFFLFSGCNDQSDEIMAVIEGKDTVTVDRFRNLLIEKYGRDISKLTMTDRKKYLETAIHDRLKLLYAREQGYDRDINFDEERMKHMLLSSSAYEKYIIGHFINDAYISRYQQYLGVTIATKNIVVRFKERPMDRGALSKEMARKKIDSIYSLVNAFNFQELVEKASDYQGATSMSRGVAYDKIIIGKWPLNYETEILSLKSGMLSRPIELEDAFVISQIVSIDESTKQNVDRNQIIAGLKEKLNTYDNHLILKFYHQFMDSLYAIHGVKIVNKNIETMLDKLKDTTNIYQAVSQFNEQVLDLQLALYSGGGVTIKQFLQSHNKDYVFKLTKDYVTQKIKEICQDIFFEKLIIDEGVLEANDFRYKLLDLKENAILDNLNKQINLSDTSVTDRDIKTFFENNRLLFVDNGIITISEIHGSSLKEIETLRDMLRSEENFEKTVKLFESKSKTKIKFSPKLTSNFSFKDEISARAIRMKKGEISEIIPKKSGGYSVIKLIDKKEPFLLSFESVKDKIKNSYIIALFQKREQKLLAELKQRWRVILFEHNLAKL